MDYKNIQEKLQIASKNVTQSKEKACLFLKSAGITTKKGNLSPKYK